MTSLRKITANRANAKASTGAKTARGKQRVGQNARRHGLSLPVMATPALSQQAEALAQQIADGSTDAMIINLARRIAEAQVDLLRIRRTRQDLFVHHACDPDGGAATNVTKDLVALDRYERRALSRRKFAIRELDAARR